MHYYQLTLVGDTYLTPLKILECLKLIRLQTTTKVIGVVQHWKDADNAIESIKKHFHVILESSEALDLPKYNEPLNAGGTYLESCKDIPFNEIGNFWRYLINGHCDFNIVIEIDGIYIAQSMKFSVNQMIADWLYYKDKVKSNFLHYFMLRKYGNIYLSQIKNLKEVLKDD